MKIELRKVKICKWMSEETTCYQAEIWIDGKKVGDASNEGHGGPDMIHGKATIDGVTQSLHCVLDEYATKMLPIRQTKWGEIKPNAEILMGKLLTDWEARKAFEKDIAKKVLYTKDSKNDKVYEFKMARKLPDGGVAVLSVNAVSDILKRNKFIGSDGSSLNNLPIEEAFSIYKKVVFPEVELV